MRIIETMGYVLWYGTFVLFGVTFGLLLHPLIASADVSEHFDAFTAGVDIATSSTTWIEYPNAPTYKLPNIVTSQYVSSPNGLLFDRGIESGNVGLKRFLDSMQSDFDLSWKQMTVSNSAGNYGIGTSFSFCDLGSTCTTRAVCTYASTTALVEIRVSTDTTTTCKGTYKVVGIVTENTWYDVHVSTDDTTDVITVTVDDGFGVQTATSSKPAGSDYVGYFLMLQSLTNTDEYFDDFGWSTTGGTTGGAGTADISVSVDYYDEDVNGDRDTTTDVEQVCYGEAGQTVTCALDTSLFDAFSVSVNGTVADPYHVTVEVLNPTTFSPISPSNQYTQAIYPTTYPYTLAEEYAFYFPAYQVNASSSVLLRVCQNLNGTFSFFGYQELGDCVNLYLGNGLATTSVEAIADKPYTDLANSLTSPYEKCKEETEAEDAGWWDIQFLAGIKCGFVWLFVPNLVEGTHWWKNLGVEQHAPFVYVAQIRDVFSAWSSATTTDQYTYDLSFDMPWGTSTMTVFDTEWVDTFPLWDWVYELLGLMMYLMALMYVYRSVMNLV